MTERQETVEIIKVADVYSGKELNVNASRKKLHTYSGKNHTVNYCAPIVENGEETMFWAEYKEQNAPLPTVEERLKSFGNALYISFCLAVDSDPDGSIWRGFVDFVRLNEDEFFNKDGDFRKRFRISPEEGMRIAKNL